MFNQIKEFFKKSFQKSDDIKLFDKRHPANLYEYNLIQVRNMAISEGWKEVDHQVHIFMVCFVKLINKDHTKILIYYSTMTVCTTLTHPQTKWRRQLTRRAVPFTMLAQIFKNPRIHSGEGYYKKHELYPHK